jgi:glycine/D-amino acid oxidase-like deaminating enzyme
MTERASALQADVAIVGGGIVGSAAALFLRRFGLSVVLLERGLCGAAASGVNYGGVRVQGRSLSQLPLALRSRQIWADAAGADRHRRRVRAVGPPEAGAHRGRPGAAGSLCPAGRRPGAGPAAE